METLECDSCGWRVPITRQHVNTACWVCSDGMQRESTTTLSELSEMQRLDRIRSIGFVLETRNL